MRYNSKNLFDNNTLLIGTQHLLELKVGGHDLSRRLVVKELKGFSFREYLNLKHKWDFERLSFKDLVKDHKSIANEILDKIKDARILILFKS